MFNVFSVFNPVRLPRRALRALAWLLVGTLLFAQFAVAAHACPQMAAGEQAAMVAAADQDSGADPAMVCGEHCKSGQQSDQPSPAATPALPLRGVLHRLPTRPEPAAPRCATAGAIDSLVQAEPPHAILHCVFRI